MMRWSKLLVLTLFAATLQAQSVSVTVNGVATGAVMTQGDSISWQITLPTGATSMNSLWVDVNSNGKVDSATDKLIFSFSQTDGVAGSNGPGDMDGVANGVILTGFAAGLAPVHWIFTATSGAGSDTSAFTVQALSSPVTVISGQITAPVGFDKSYILIETDPASGSGGMDIFWQGLTDVNGNYSINVGGDPAARNPWRVRVSDNVNLGAYIATPRDTTVNLGGASVTVNFNLTKGTVLTGIVKDQSNVPIERAFPHLHSSNDPAANVNIGMDTGPDGRYTFAAPAGTWLLHFTADGYKDQWWNGKTSSGLADVITITSQDSIKDLNGTLVKAGLIRGVVRSMGTPVSGVMVWLTLQGSMFTVSTNTRDDGSYGFTVDPGTYYVKFTFGTDTLYYNQQTSGPGTAIVISGTETISGVDANFGVTGVSTVQDVPSAFAIHQNYPNPFNPTTQIVYDLPVETSVRLAVFNTLGQQVALIVDGLQAAGRHAATFDAAGLPSGVYLCRLQAGTKLLLTKMSLVR